MKLQQFVGTFLVALSGLFPISLSAQAGPDSHVPKGLYINFLLRDAVNQAQQAASSVNPALPDYPNPAADAILVNYFMVLLDNPAVSGLAPMMTLQLLNPNNPAHPETGPAYIWNPLDDVFTAVDKWNTSHPFLPRKTIQIINSSGFDAPQWVFNDIDNSVCGLNNPTCTGSCDGLFMSPESVPAPPPQCGYTTIFWATEGGPPRQIPLPMPWNSIYKADHQAYVTALYQHILQEPSSDAFVSITMSGPTASSAEMILPNLENQSFGGNHGILTLPNNVPTIANLNAADVWNKLINNYYGASSGFANTDQPFIQEWNNTIDVYSQIFSGVTLVLTTTSDALPDFIDWNSTLPISSPAPGFESDCGITNAVPLVQNNQQQCAAVTWVLYHFTNPTVGGNNAKSVFEAGMTAARDGYDLGTNGIRWLAADTAAGLMPLQGTPYRMSRMLGGVQFSHDFSPPDTLQSEGCPTFPMTTCGTTANPFTPAQGLGNVLQLSYFPGTAVGPIFGAPASVNYGKWAYKDAPVNFLEIYDTDILYSSGLSNCSMLLITGSPLNNMLPDLRSCPATPPLGGFASVLTSQVELDLANLGILLIAEPAEP
jgi:hypothetical protein